jgi:hypothetical protein
MDRDRFWGMGQGQDGSEEFRVGPASPVAHLYGYRRPHGRPLADEMPSCGVRIPFSVTHPAVHGDTRCVDCENMYDLNSGVVSYAR